MQIIISINFLLSLFIHLVTNGKIRFFKSSFTPNQKRYLKKMHCSYSKITVEDSVQIILITNLVLKHSVLSKETK